MSYIKIKNIFEKMWKMVYRSSVVVFLAVLLGCGLFILRMIPEDTTFHSEYTNAAKEAQNIVNNSCKGESCKRRDWVFVAGLYKGMEVEIDDVNDNEILQKVVGVFIKTFADTINMKHAIIKKHSTSKISKEKDFIIELRRD